MKKTDIIKYDEENLFLIWKHPIENFSQNTQLIVQEAQEAIFFKNGQALDLFGPGAHALNIQNIPLINYQMNKGKNDLAAFHCAVYFINMSEHMGIKWGTTSKIEYMDPVYNFPVSIGLSGEMNIYVENSRKLLLKLSMSENSVSVDEITSLFRGIIITKIKSYIGQVVKKGNINIFQLDENLQFFSEEIKSLLLRDFAEYGIVLNRFLVTTVVKPDGEPIYERFRELHYRQFTDIAEAKLQKKIDMIKNQRMGSLCFCENCGKSIQMTDNVCRHCNTKQNLKKNCESCGFVLSLDSNFCPNCGNENI